MIERERDYIGGAIVALCHPDNTCGECGHRRYDGWCGITPGFVDADTQACNRFWEPEEEEEGEENA